MSPKHTHGLGLGKTGVKELQSALLSSLRVAREELGWFARAGGIELDELVGITRVSTRMGSSSSSSKVRSMVDACVLGAAPPRCAKLGVPPSMRTTRTVSSAVAAWRLSSWATLGPGAINSRDMQRSGPAAQLR